MQAKTNPKNHGFVAFTSKSKLVTKREPTRDLGYEALIQGTRPDLTRMTRPNQGRGHATAPARDRRPVP